MAAWVWTVLAGVAWAAFASGDAVVRWGACGVLAVVGGSIVAANWVNVLGARRAAGPPAVLPVLGALLVATAMCASNAGSLGEWAWMPFLLDPGSLPSALFAGVLAVRVRLLDRRRSAS